LYIRNGLAAAIAPAKMDSSLDLTKGILGFAAPLMGCGGMVEMNKIPSKINCCLLYALQYHDHDRCFNERKGWLIGDIGDIGDAQNDVSNREIEKI
jgi:hypothetical protein